MPCTRKQLSFFITSKGRSRGIDAPFTTKLSFIRCGGALSYRLSPAFGNVACFVKNLGPKTQSTRVLFRAKHHRFPGTQIIPFELPHAHFDGCKTFSQSGRSLFGKKTWGCWPYQLLNLVNTQTFQGSKPFPTCRTSLVADGSSISSNFWVMETTPKTNISDISDVSRPHLFFWYLRTSNLLLPGFLRKSRFFVPVQCQIGCCRTVLMMFFVFELIFEIVPISLQKWSKLKRCSIHFLSISSGGYIMGYGPKS